MEEEEEEEDEVEDGEADDDVESEPVDTVATLHVSGYKSQGRSHSYRFQTVLPPHHYSSRPRQVP